MANPTIAPTPIAGNMGIGYWQDLKDKMASVNKLLTDNSDYDSSVNTVDELLAAVDDVIAAMQP